MKTLLLALVLALCTFASPEQPPFKLEGKTFVQQVQNNDILTDFTYQDTKGNVYPIYLHQYTSGEKKGQYTTYIIKISKNSGKEYKYYLSPEITEKVLENYK